MAAANGVGGDGCVRASEREEAEERRATGRVIERSRGFGISVASSRRIGEGPGRQGGRRWPARPCACEHAAASGRGEEDDGGAAVVGWAAQELGRLGYQVSAR